MGECGGGVCVWKLALGCDVHVEECVVEVQSGIVKGSCQDAGGVQGADCKIGGWGVDVRQGCTVPVVPLEVGSAAGGRPQVGGDVDFEVAGLGVVKGGDDDGLVDVFCYVVENFPSAVVFNARP